MLVLALVIGEGLALPECAFSILLTVRLARPARPGLGRPLDAGFRRYDGVYANVSNKGAGR